MAQSSTLQTLRQCCSGRAARGRAGGTDAAPGGRALPRLLAGSGRLPRRGCWGGWFLRSGVSLALVINQYILRMLGTFYMRRKARHSALQRRTNTSRGGFGLASTAAFCLTLSAKATSEPLCEGHRTLFTLGCYQLALYLFSSATPPHAKPSFHVCFLAVTVSQVLHCSTRLLLLSF